jgi:N4-gp56 family major capsid protein
LSVSLVWLKVIEGQQWFDNVLLSRPMPKLIHKQMALKKQLPPNSGRIARYRRYTNLLTATVPLPDSGLTPPGQVLSAVDIDARIDWYGVLGYAIAA